MQCNDLPNEITSIIKLYLVELLPTLLVCSECSNILLYRHLGEVKMHLPYRLLGNVFLCTKCKPPKSYVQKDYLVDATGSLT